MQNEIGEAALQSAEVRMVVSRGYGVGHSLPNGVRRNSRTECCATPDRRLAPVEFFDDALEVVFGDVDDADFAFGVLF